MKEGRGERKQEIKKSGGENKIKKGREKDGRKKGEGGKEEEREGKRDYN